MRSLTTRLNAWLVAILVTYAVLLIPQPPHVSAIEPLGVIVVLIAGGFGGSVTGTIAGAVIFAICVLGAVHRGDLQSTLRARAKISP